MKVTTYIVDPDLAERELIEGALAGIVKQTRCLDDAEALLAILGARQDACLIVAVEPDEAAAVELVRELRLYGSTIPVVAIGPSTAFRTATDIARLEFTDFVERPLSAPRLRAAVRRACAPAT